MIGLMNLVVHVWSRNPQKSDEYGLIFVLNAYSGSKEHDGTKTKIGCGGGFWVCYFWRICLLLLRAENGVFRSESTVKHVLIEFFGPMKAPWNRQIQSDRTVILRIWNIQILTIFYYCFLSSHRSEPMVAQVLSGLSWLPTDRKRPMRAPWNRQKELVPAELFSSFSDLFENKFWSWKSLPKWNSNNTW